MATLVEELRSGRRSAVELTEDVLGRIAVREDVLHAWTCLAPDAALARARELDAVDGPVGPLHGLPVGVKDIIDTADLPTEYGSPIHAGHRPGLDATLVTRLRDAGAIVLGKTVTTEFATFSPGPTVHPEDPARTPGGSSMGSAAAVGAGTLPLAIGTQTAGSVVRPASFCGVVGAKPTIGSVPTAGVKPCAPSLDTVGTFATDVDGAARLLGVLAGDPARFRPADLGDRPRIGFCRTPWWSQIDADCAEVIEQGVQRLARHLDVVEVTLPDGFAALLDAQVTVMGVELLEALAWEREHHPELLSADLRDKLADAADRVERYEDAIAVRDRCLARLSEVFADLDVLLAPSVVGEPPQRTSTGDPLLCRAWTLLGTPTVSVPGLRGPAGLPLGVQVVADRGRDDLALGGAARVAALLTP